MSGRNLRFRASLSGDFRATRDQGLCPWTPPEGAALWTPGKGAALASREGPSALSTPVSREGGQVPCLRFARVRCLCRCTGYGKGAALASRQRGVAPWETPRRAFGPLDTRFAPAARISAWRGITHAADSLMQRRRRREGVQGTTVFFLRPLFAPAGAKPPAKHTGKAKRLPS